MASAAEDGADFTAVDVGRGAHRDTAGPVLLLADGDIQKAALAASGEAREIVEVVFDGPGLAQHVERYGGDGDLSVPVKTHAVIYHALELKPRCRYLPEEHGVHRLTVRPIAQQLRGRAKGGGVGVGVLKAARVGGERDVQKRRLLRGQIGVHALDELQHDLRAGSLLAVDKVLRRIARI